MLYIYIGNNDIDIEKKTNRNQMRQKLEKSKVCKLTLDIEVRALFYIRNKYAKQAQQKNTGLIHLSTLNAVPSTTAIKSNY